MILFNPSEAYGYFKRLRYNGASNSWGHMNLENIILVCVDIKDFDTNAPRLDITKFVSSKVVIWGITPQMEIPSIIASEVHRTPNSDFDTWVKCVKHCKPKLPQEEQKKEQKNIKTKVDTEPFVGEIVPCQFG